MRNVKRNDPFYRIYHQNAFYIEFFTEKMNLNLDFSNLPNKKKTLFHILNTIFEIFLIFIV